MTDRILESVKKVLGIAPEYLAFDQDIVMHINSAFSVLHQLGVGPDEPFMIEDETATWTEFLGTERGVNSVKSYVYLRVRLLFDPPATSFALGAMEKQIEELGWRISTYMEGVRHPYVEPVAETEEEVVW